MFRQTITAAALLALCSIVPAQAQDATDHLGVPGPITVGDTDYVLSWSSNPQPGTISRNICPRAPLLTAMRAW